MASGFERGKSDQAHHSEAEIDKLYSKIGQLVVERVFFSDRLASVARDARQKMVSVEHKLSQHRQCALLKSTRSSLYYRPVGESAESLRVMEIIDKQFSRRLGTGPARWHVTCSVKGTSAGVTGSAAFVGATPHWGLS